MLRLGNPHAESGCTGGEGAAVLAVLQHGQVPFLAGEFAHGAVLRSGGQR